jgi:hypothetical protein
MKQPYQSPLVLLGCLMVNSITVTDVAVAASPHKAASVVGADRDSHGCIGSAGYAFSQLQAKCVRLFESGIRLDPLAKGHGSTQSAFIVFRTEAGEGTAELFLPGKKLSLLMKQVAGENAGLWRAPGYKLSQWKGMYMLDTAKGKSLYQGMDAR